MLAASRSAWRAVAAATAVGLFVMCSVTSVAATPHSDNVRSVIISSVGDGLHLLAPGPYNGPITQSVIAPYISSNATAQQALKDGDITGYVRTWRSKPALHEGIVDTVIGLPVPSDGPPFVAGVVRSALAAQPNLVSIPVNGIPGATLFRTVVSTQTTTLEEWYLIFDRGRFASIIVAAAPVGSLITSFVTSVGEKQFTQFPIPPPVAAPSDWGPVIVVGFVVILVGAAVVTFITVATSRRRRARQSVQTGPYRYPAVSVAGVTPRAPAYRPVYVEQSSSPIAPTLLPTTQLANTSSADPIRPPTPRLASDSERPSAPLDDRSAFWDE